MRARKGAQCSLAVCGKPFICSRENLTVSNMDVVTSKAIGCLYGLAVGDAMGMPTEIMTIDEIQKKHGWISEFVDPPRIHPIAGEVGLKLGQVTDDTMQALITAKVLIEFGKIVPEAILEGLYGWLKSEHITTNFLGPSTRKALEIFASTRTVDEKALRSNATDGAAMRIAPVGIFYHGDCEKAYEAAILASKTTHTSSVAISSAVCVACSVAAAMENDASVESVVESALYWSEKASKLGLTGLGYAPIHSRTKLALDLTKGADGMKALRIIHDYIGHSLMSNEAVPAAITLFKLSEGDPLKAVAMATNLGGDSDTVAAMTGAMSGAFKGIDAIPASLTKKIEEVNKLDLDRVAVALLEKKKELER